MDFSRVRLTDGNIRAHLYLYEAVNNLLFVNFYWSLVNLLPVYPLDGGQILRACLAHRRGALGRTCALQISIGVAASIAAAALCQRNLAKLPFAERRKPAIYSFELLQPRVLKRVGSHGENDP
jgi:Zn-dependent protease